MHGSTKLHDLPVSRANSRASGSQLVKHPSFTPASPKGRNRIIYCPKKGTMFIHLHFEGSPSIIISISQSKMVQLPHGIVSNNSDLSLKRNEKVMQYTITCRKPSLCFGKAKIIEGIWYPKFAYLS